MKHLPLFFDLAGRKVAVVGEGPKADLRADLARSAGADVRRLDARSLTAQDLRGAVAAFIAGGYEGC
ncbi:MAG: uroporphyrinogen-III C-methyltransferase, partial [Reyranella sp.]